MAWPPQDCVTWARDVPSLGLVSLPVRSGWHPSPGHWKTGGHSRILLPQPHPTDSQHSLALTGCHLHARGTSCPPNSVLFPPRAWGGPLVHLKARLVGGAGLGPHGAVEATCPSSQGQLVGTPRPFHASDRRRTGGGHTHWYRSAEPTLARQRWLRPSLRAPIGPCWQEAEGTHLTRPSSCKVVALLGRAGALPKCRRRGCRGCRRLTRPSLTGSQSRLGMSSWLGSRQHSSTRASSGSLGGPSSRPVWRGRV